MPRPAPLLASLALLLAAGALLPSRAAAQSCATPTSTFPISTPAVVDFGTPRLTQADFDAGYVERTVTLSFTPATGQNFVVCVQYPAGSASLGNGKPLADLLFQSLGGTGFVPVGTSPQPIYTGKGKSLTTVTVTLRILLRWTTDTPFNAYGAALTFFGTH